MAKKQWAVEFNRIKVYEVKVEANSPEQAEKLAWTLITEQPPNDYFVNDEGLECVYVCETEV